ncbi:MAG: hypothetical protein DMG78_02150 [Acidobacteria bacterium]|nr:MAG: hypothetical protein DMG78_02150 [Acidobacteriota bacterium]
MERRLGAKVFLDNDANVAALGEKWLGAGRDADNMAMLTLGTGIGGAIVLKGKLFYGMSGMAGEFGHVTVEPNGVPCGCGNRGCAERYASATAIVRMAREAIESGEAPELAKAASTDPEFSAKSIYNLALQGDAAAQRIFQRFGEVLGILLADLVNVLDLDMYVIGGGVVSAWDRSTGKKGRRVSANRQLHQKENDHHAGVVRQRCRPLRRGKNSGVPVAPPSRRLWRGRLAPTSGQSHGARVSRLAKMSALRSCASPQEIPHSAAPSQC